ncbi:MAG: hypothetical protein LBI13_01655 [Streptococcaceae bacterium]|jgi:hypothetical protein|nr:hypothetical protein [Streptococcaceae bacterium]
MWSSGTLEIDGVMLTYEVKHFEFGSQYGIDEGRISKLSIRIKGKEVLHYERGWDLRPKEQVAKVALAQLLKLYN